MTDRIRTGMATRAVMALVLLFMTACAAATTLDEIRDRGFIRIAVANEIPYGYVAGKDNAEGFGPDTAKQVLADMGIGQIHWSVVPFGKLISAVNEGQVDMAAASQAILPGRCEQVLFSRPNTSYGEGLLVLAGNPKALRSYADLADKPELRLGVVSGTIEADFAHDAGITARQLVPLKASTDAASALTSGRIDAYAGTQFTVAQIGDRNNGVAAAEPYPKKPFPWNPFKDPIVGGHKMRSWGAFTFAKDSSELRDAFNKSLQAFQQTRDWRDILARYGLDQRSVEAIDKKTTAELCKGDAD